ncbi:MAG: UvrB/UvrC motif-containing protein [Candidatus Zixiibacteriota bacterium]|nr:UvrB/UvrC motif-containing protein [candidate division Zixibacteria bacterium]
MLCQECGKNEAGVHLTQIVNNKKTVLNLCRDCAEKRGMTANPLVQVPFPLAEILSSMMGETPEKKKGRSGEARCPGCGFTFAEFSKVGRFGCGQCYRTFQPQVSDLLRRIHGSTRHIGRKPTQVPHKETVLIEEKRLEDELKKAIAAEDFEKAARLRDRIKTLMRQD